MNETHHGADQPVKKIF